jgi:hypothetical protein
MLITEGRWALADRSRRGRRRGAACNAEDIARCDEKSRSRPTSSPPASVDGMVRIEGPPIKANIPPKTTQLDEPLRAVVTPFAERLEWAEPELVHVPVMRLDVIADCRRGYYAALEAELA